MIQKKTNYHNKKNEIVINKNKSKMDNILEKLIPKIKDNRYSTAEFLKLYEKKNEELNKNELEGKNKRKNNPYKGIITNFDYNKKINDNKDLIVFKPQDENKEDFEKDFKNHNSIIEQQDIENKNIYSEDNKINYIKNFEYVQKYKYRMDIDKNVDDGAGDNIRMDRIEHYDKKKIEEQNNSVMIEDIFNDLISNGILTEDLDNIDIDKIDIVKMEKTIVEKYGKAKYDEFMKEL